MAGAGNNARTNAKQGQITEMELSRQMSFKDADSFMAMASPVRKNDHINFLANNDSGSREDGLLIEASVGKLEDGGVEQQREQ